MGVNAIRPRSPNIINIKNAESKYRIFINMSHAHFLLFKTKFERIKNNKKKTNTKISIACPKPQPKSLKHEDLDDNE